MISSTRPFVYAFLGLYWSMHHINLKCTATIMVIKWGQNQIKMFILEIHTSPMPCYFIAMQIVHHSSWNDCLLDAFIHMLVHFIYVGPCLFGSSSNRRWAGDISRNPGALPRSFSRFNWAARQALPHACIHIVPTASILFLHHWVAIALNWIPCTAQPDRKSVV